MILVSACLVGCHCRYDGGTKERPDLVKLIRQGRAVPVCPEQMGGLPTPRVPAEIVGGDGEAVLDGRARVVNSAGDDVTAQFLAGAREALRMAEAAGASVAILKERSPSCGSAAIYDGTFSGATVPGAGVTAALLRRHGVRVYSEETWDGGTGNAHT
ncbi:MAG: DUF523 domain-containing protein [Symbiobacterium sp.]|uniref:DUF523 domain-containing protein n=1 Tax=Symbiobacterium sp. TaxID=1971213 RepID=UPI003463DC98